MLQLKLKHCDFANVTDDLELIVTRLINAKVYKLTIELKEDSIKYLAKVANRVNNMSDSDFQLLGSIVKDNS